MKSRAKIVMQEHIEFKDKWFEREKVNTGKLLCPSESHQRAISLQVSSATEAHTHLESRLFNIAILPHAPETPQHFPGSLHMTVSWVGGLMVFAWRRWTDAIYMHAKSFQSCPTLCDSMNGSLPGSSVRGIL